MKSHAFALLFCSSLEPPAEIDRHMPVTPKPGTDYKMTVKEPAVESMK